MFQSIFNEVLFFIILITHDLCFQREANTGLTSLYLIQISNEKRLIFQLQKDGTLSGFVEQVTSKLNSTLTDLKQNAPDANQLQEKFSKAVQTVIDESKKLSDVLKNEGEEAHVNIKNILTQTLNQTGTLANEFQVNYTH